MPPLLAWENVFWIEVGTPIRLRKCTVSSGSPMDGINSLQAALCLGICIKFIDPFLCPRHEMAEGHIEFTLSVCVCVCVCVCECVCVYVFQNRFRPIT